MKVNNLFLQGRRREEVQFVDAVVDNSLGNIRENIRKSANQKHVSTSMVDPVKEMRKSGNDLQIQFHASLPYYLFRSKCARVEENASAQVSRGVGEGKRDPIKSTLVKRQAEQSNYSYEIWLVIALSLFFFKAFP